MDADKEHLAAIAAKYRSRALPGGGSEAGSSISPPCEVKSPDPKKARTPTTTTKFGEAPTFDPKIGPSLRGTPEQLEAARLALQGFNIAPQRNSKKSRPSARHSISKLSSHPYAKRAPRVTTNLPNSSVPLSVPTGSYWDTVIEPRSETVPTVNQSPTRSSASKLPEVGPDVTAEQGAASITMTPDHTASFEANIAGLKGEVKDLNHEIFKLQRQFDRILCAQEKREFMGSDHAKTPFEVWVTSGDAVFKIQADAMMKVADFIRRIRCVRNLLPYQSVNPRIEFEGYKVGHGMSLGELGIRSKSQVTFTYDSIVEDEEL